MIASKIEIVVRGEAGKEIPSSDLAHAIYLVQKKFQELGYVSNASFSHIQIVEAE